MYLPIALCTPLMAFSLFAQQPDAPKPAAQDPAAQESQDPNSRIQELVEERARLEQEIQYAKERSKNAKALLRERLGGVQQGFKAIDAGKIASNRPAPRPPRKYARLMTADEVNSQQDGTMVVVADRAIGSGFFNRVMDYMRESSIGADDNMLAQRVLFDMIRIEAVAAAFYESKGEADIGDALMMLQKGKSMDDVIEKYGTVRGADEKGVLEIQRNSVHGPFFEHMAFGTEPGKRAQPFRNVFGYVLLEVVERKKGATENQDTIVCKVAQVDYTDDAAALSQAQMAVNTGQLDIKVRDEQTMEMLPAMFKEPQRAQPMERDEALKQRISMLGTALEKLEEAGEGESEQAQKLREQMQQLGEMLEKMRGERKQDDAPRAPESADKK